MLAHAENPGSGSGPVDTSQSPFACWKTLELNSISLNEGFLGPKTNNK